MDFKVFIKKIYKLFCNGESLSDVKKNLSTDNYKHVYTLFHTAMGKSGKISEMKEINIEEPLVYLDFEISNFMSEQDKQNLLKILEVEDDVCICTSDTECNCVCENCICDSEDDEKVNTEK